jgi:pseudouridine synthase
MSIRLNKFLADRGVASRRASDRLIEDGRVRINGRVVTDLGTKVEEQRDKVSVNGKPVGGRERHVYFVLNKPVGFITTLDDPEGRHTVRELMPRGARVYPVGRLDADTSGLLLLTNDGDLAHRLAHPRYEVDKVYEVECWTQPTDADLQRLRDGVELEDGPTRPADVRRIDGATIELVIHEGRNRQVRRMLEAVGHRVKRLHRSRYANLTVDALSSGEWRELERDEAHALVQPAQRRR